MDFLCFAYLCLRTEHGNSFYFVFDLEKVDVAISQPPFASQSQQWKYKNNVGNLFKVNNKDIRTTSLKLLRLMLLSPSRFYIFKVKNGMTRTMSEFCLKLTIKTPERRH